MKDAIPGTCEGPNSVYLSLGAITCISPGSCPSLMILRRSYQLPSAQFLRAGQRSALDPASQGVRRRLPLLDSR